MCTASISIVSAPTSPVVERVLALIRPQASFHDIELLERLDALGNRMPVLMITGYPTIRTALQAMRLGALDYLPKPLTRQELLAPWWSRGTRGSVWASAATRSIELV